MELRITEKLQLQDEILKETAEGVYLIRVADGIIVYTNPRFEKMFGYEPGEMIGKHVSIVNVPTDKSPEETTREIMGILERTGEWHGEVKNIKKDGTPFWCSASISAFLHPRFGEVWISVHTDITDRKKAEKTLKESEEKYRALIETTNTGYLILNSEGKVIDANAEYVRLTGHRELSDILGKNVVEWTADYDKQKNAESVAKCAKDRFIRNLLIDYVDKKGQSTPIEINGTVIGNGKSMHIISLCRDITERKQVEKILKESEEKYRTLVHNSQNGVFIIQDGKMQFINETFAKMVGYTMDEVVGMDFKLFVAPEDREMAADHYLRRQAGEDVSREYEVRLLHNNGITRIFVILNVGIINYHGKIATMGTVKDITERKESENLLKKSEEKYRNLIENLSEGIWLIDKDNITTFVNKKMSEMMGYTVNEMIGESLFYFMDEKGKNITKDNLERRRKSIKEEHGFELIRKNGSKLYVRLKFKPIVDEEGNYMGALTEVVDVTEQKKPEEK